MDAIVPAGLVDAIGFLAGGFTILAYAQRVAVPLRCFGLAANSSFIAYGTLSGAPPVVTLHVVLLAVNLVRLRGALRARAARASVPARGAFAMFPARARIGPA